MEALLVLLGFGVIVGPWILAVVSFVRSNRLSRRVELLERRMDLRAAVPGAVAPAPAAEAPPAPPPPSMPAPFEERPLETVLAPPPAQLEAPTPAAARAAGPGPEQQAPPGSLEERLALVWLTRAGALVVLLGAATFFKWAVDNEYIGPTGRVALGILAGVGAIAAGEALRARTRALWVNAVQGAGVALLFVSIFAAAALYQLVPFGLAFAAVAIVAGAGCALSLRGRSEVVLALSLLGGLLAPVLLSTGKDNPGGLFGWLLLVAGAALAVSARLGFRIVPWLALGGTAFLFGGWHDAYFEVWPPAGLAPDPSDPAADVGAYHRLSTRLLPLALVLAHLGAWLAFWTGVRREQGWPRLLSDLWLTVSLAALHVAPFALLFDRPLAVGAVVAVAGLAAAVLALRAERPFLHPAAAALGALLLAAAVERGWPSLGAAALWGAAHLAASARGLLALTGAGVDSPAGTRAVRVATASALVTAALAGLGFAGLTILATGPDQDLLRAALLGAAGAAELGLGAALLPRGRARATVLLGSALGLVAAAAAFLLSGAGITVAWAALAAAVGVVAARERDRAWLAGALALFALAVLRAFTVDLAAVDSARYLFLSSAGTEGALSPRLLLNPRGVGLVASAVALLVGARAASRAAAGERARPWREVAGVLAVAAHGALLALAIAEVRDLVVRLPPPPSVGDALAFEEYRPAFYTALAAHSGVMDTATTVVLGLYASVVLVIGFVAREVLHRWLGLALFAVTLAKVLLSDVWRLGSGLRILVFMASGLLMLAAGFLYARYGKRILGLMKEPPPGAGRAALLLVAAGLAAVPGLASAEDPARTLLVAPYASERAIEGVRAPGLHAVRVDDALWKASLAAPGTLADVRVEGPGGEEVPWALRRVARPPVEEEVAVTLLDPVVLPDGAVRAVLDKGRPGLRTDELRLDLEGEDFLRRVRLESSEDGRRFGVLADGPRVYAVPGGDGLAPARRTSVPHAPSEARWLRVTLLPGQASGRSAEGPPRLTGAHAIRRPAAPLRRDSLALPAPPRVADPERKASRLDLDLGAPGVPVDAVVVAVSTPTFERRVRVLGSEDGRSWATLGDGLLFRVPGDEELRVTIRPAGRRWLRLEVHDGDAAPLVIERVTVEWPAQELAFDARAAGRHRLLAGSERVPAPVYDLAAVLERSPDAAATPAALGPVRANPGHRPHADPVPFTERHRGILGAVLGLVLVALGLFSFRLLRRAA